MPSHHKAPETTMTTACLKTPTPSTAEGQAPLPNLSTPRESQGLVSPLIPSSPGMMLMESSGSYETPTIARTPRSSYSSSGSHAERSEGIPDDTPLSARSSPERIVEAQRLLVEMKSRVFTDCENFCPWGIAQGLMTSKQYEQSVGEVTADLLKRSTALKLHMIVAGEEGKAEGQAFLIETNKGTVLSTVMHHFCTEIKKKGIVEECAGAVLVSPSNKLMAFPFNRHRTIMNWDADADADCTAVDASLRWKYGHELFFVAEDDQDTRCARLLNELNQQTVTPYKAVNSTFEIKEGMQVGIVARSSTGMLAESLQKCLPSEEGYTAQAGDVFITVGEITHVGAQHIEYSVNTVPGFSGGAVVLLDTENDYHMHVLAAHAGYSEAKATNFGLLVANKVKEYEAS